MRTLRLAHTVNKYSRYVMQHRAEPISNGRVRYHADIHIPKLNREKVTAVLAERILQGRHQFYMPYTLTEINNDGTIDPKTQKFIPTSENQNICDWIKNQGIEYELFPLRTLLLFHDKCEIYYPYNREFLNWLHKKNPLEYPLTHSGGRIGEKVSINYDAAHMWMELTENTQLDESCFQFIENKI